MRMSPMLLVIALAGMTALGLLGCSGCGEDYMSLNCLFGGEDVILPDTAPFDLSIHVSSSHSWTGKHLVATVDAPGVEAQRWEEDSLTSGSQWFTARDYLDPARVYEVDVWIDLDADGSCDVPPEDAVWHIVIAYPSGPKEVAPESSTMATACP